MFQLVPFEDLQSFTIHIVKGSDNNYGLCFYHITSLNSNGVEDDWFQSCKFSKPCSLDAFTPLGDYVYCFERNNRQSPQFQSLQFLAHSSVDFSSEPSHILARFPLTYDYPSQKPKMVGFDKKDIYLLNDYCILNEGSPPERFSVEEFKRGLSCYKCE